MTIEIKYREATVADVPDMIDSRIGDPMGPADARMGIYLEGKHHPQQALAPRVIFVALQDTTVIGYIGGHLTRRHDCDGELQYLYVVEVRRRDGIASAMLRLLARWFAEQSAARICVDVALDNSTARAFYGRTGAVDLDPHWMVWPDITTGLGGTQVCAGARRGLE